MIRRAAPGWIAFITWILASCQAGDQSPNQPVDYRGGWLIPDEDSLESQADVFEPKADDLDNLPASVDLSARMPPPGRQVSDSCVAWALAYSAKTYQEAVEEQWDPSETSHRFSPTWLYNLLNGGRDQGIEMGKALEWITNYGIDTLDKFDSPYDLQAQPDFDSFVRAARYKTTSWELLPDDPLAIKAVVARGQVVPFGILAGSDLFSCGPDNPVYDNVDGASTGHAMVIVGYDDDRQAFKIFNSWGSGWGFGGTCWLAYELTTRVDSIFQAYHWVDAPNQDPVIVSRMVSPQPGSRLRRSCHLEVHAAGTMGRPVRAEFYRKDFRGDDPFDLIQAVDSPRVQDGTHVFEYDWNTVGVGQYALIKALVIDDAGNQTETPRIRVMIEGQNAFMDVSYPPDGSRVHGTVPVRLEIENQYKPSEVKIELVGQGDLFPYRETLALFEPREDGVYSVDWDTTRNNPGDYSLAFTAHGNVDRRWNDYVVLAITVDQDCTSADCVGRCVDRCEAGQRACVDRHAFAVCGQSDTNDCLVWGKDIKCDSDRVCQEGLCVTACQDQCIPSDVGCLDEHTRWTCQDDASQCLTRQAVQCEQGLVCHQGQCQARTDILLASADTPLDIPDCESTGIRSRIEVSAAGTSGRIEVDVDITHTYIGDLLVYLESPNGQSQRLHDRSGFGSDDLHKSYSLADLAGQSASGTWTLGVQDLACQDTGTLVNWSLSIDVEGGGNQAPVAHSGDSQIVSGGDLVELDGSASYDPEGQALTFHWVQTEGPEVSLSDPRSARTTFVAPVSAVPLQLSFALQVGDSQLASPYQAVSVTVLAASGAHIEKASTDTPVAIPDDDASGIQSIIQVNEEGTVAELEVDVHITHSFIGDLVISLETPDHNTVILRDRRGIDTHDYSEVFSVDHLTGSPVSGSWGLRVSDRSRNDTGHLQSFVLRIRK